MIDLSLPKHSFLSLGLLLVAASAQGPPSFGGGPPRRPGDDSPVEEGRRGRGGMRGMMMRMAPVMRVLDKDEDGELSAEEIASASIELATLDKDQNGKLESSEMAPRFLGGRRGGVVEEMSRASTSLGLLATSCEAGP